MRDTAWPERRGDPRYEIAADIAVGGRFPARCVNLSSRGIYFCSDQAFISGQEVSMVLPFTSARPCHTRVTCTARIVRVERLRDGYGVAAVYDPVAFEVTENTNQ